jgi:hypothetical protein
MREHSDQASRTGRGSGRRPTEQPLPPAESVLGWFAGRLPDDWFVEPPELSVDRDEVIVVGRIAAPDLPEGASAAERAAAESGRVQRFREQTRQQRMQLADEAEHLFGRKVAWGAQAGDSRHLFTTLSVPVMTRLRQPERRVLDTLVEAGVARSRSDALAWCVRLVGEHTAEWLTELRESLEAVQRLREAGPTPPGAA